MARLESRICVPLLSAVSHRLRRYGSQVDHLAFVDDGRGLDNASLQKWMQVSSDPNPGTAGGITRPDANSCKFFADGDLSQVGIISRTGS